MAHSKSTSTPTKKTSKMLKVRKSKSSRDEGCTGGLKLLKRNPVTMPRMTTSRILKKRLTVEFDKDGTPIGKNGDALQSYIGVLARSKIPISIESWTDKIIATEKNNIWETILTSFNLGAENKKMVLQSAGAKWREFKCRLTTDDYRFINVDDWTTFVAQRTTDAFMELHEAQRARRQKNIYDHHMSRKGYAGLRQELSKTMPDEEIDRATLWIKGRQTKQGTFKDVRVKETAVKKLYIPYASL
ncbi:hypothetical protein M0R45_000604 [Rubus argutus]|uniref:Uncharacterized protein n=1 Tax=Rubus argutus TaxID=59490 RepID=A0AAW1VPL0_RUBAR